MLILSRYRSSGWSNASQEWNHFILYPHIWQWHLSSFAWIWNSSFKHDFLWCPSISSMHRFLMYLNLAGSEWIFVIFVTTKVKNSSFQNVLNGWGMTETGAGGVLNTNQNALGVARYILGCPNFLETWNFQGWIWNQDTLLLGIC